MDSPSKYTNQFFRASLQQPTITYSSCKPQIYNFCKRSLACLLELTTSTFLPNPSSRLTVPDFCKQSTRWSSRKGEAQERPRMKWAKRCLPDLTKTDTYLSQTVLESESIFMQILWNYPSESLKELPFIRGLDPSPYSAILVQLLSFSIISTSKVHGCWRGLKNSIRWKRGRKGWTRSLEVFCLALDSAVLMSCFFFKSF